MQQIEAALSHISPEDRDLWVRMAMAVKSQLGETGFDVWDTWSQGSDRYRAADARAVWRSCRASGGITIASLFAEARANGYQGAADPVIAPPARSTAREAAEAKELTAKRLRAAQTAARILSQCNLEQHAYLHSKGFPDQRGLVWWRGEDDNVLVIPMYVGTKLVNAQLIDRQCRKKFLPGVAGGAEYTFRSGNGIHLLCEGYATGLSAQAAMAKLCLRYTVHVCFSAGNLPRIARGLSTGFVIADNDASGVGERVAQQIGWPYWMSDAAGEDFNDFHQRVGLFRASQELGRFIRREMNSQVAA